jgi:2,4-dienoyl-CoA reductase-like NADH-dependent reductase (Old Yellow Enzyme family)
MTSMAAGRGDEYRHVLAPISIAGLEVPNRIVRTAHATGLAMNGAGGDFIAYHEEPARSGVGLTIIEAAAVHRNSIGRLRFENDSLLPEYSAALRQLRKYPMKLFQQLNHVGRAFMTPAGDPPWSASAVASPRIAHGELSQLPLAITVSQIDDIVEHFASAAARVVSAGIDGIEINAAHGYLIAQFLSPLTNRRADEYGGSRENRVRMLVRILQAVRAATYSALPLGIRLSADEMFPGGIAPAEASAIADIVTQAGLIDFLNVSLGSPMNVTKVIGGMEEPPGYELPWSGQVTQRATVPAIVAGRITSLQQADELIRDGLTDMVSMVRAHIADPELVTKSLAGQAHRVRPCIGCNQGCVGAANSPYGRFGCTVNPTAGFEALSRGAPATRTRARILVVGGGAAGMEAARAAAAQGDDVILCEASGQLGGQLTIARQAPTRERIGELADWLVQELDVLGVDVRLNTDVDADYALSQQIDRVIVATGSVPRIDGFTIADPDRPTKGVDHQHVVTSWAAITDSTIAGVPAVVFDDIGHHEAVSAAEALIARGCSVTFVTRLNRLMPLLEAARMDTTVKQRLYAGPFEFVPDSRLTEIGPDCVSIARLYGGRSFQASAQSVVLVGSNIPRRTLADELAGRLDVTLVGDALGPRFLQLAVLEGYRAATNPALLPGASRSF